MSGWYAMRRGWLDHECFKPIGKWSRAEAWVWMVESAPYKDTEITRGSKTVLVPRGHIHHSIRFMAKKFRWSDKAVRVFIDSLVKAKAVEKIGAHLGAHLGAQLKLCNYDKYQFEGHTQGHTQGHKEEQINKLTNIPVGESDDSDHGQTIQVSVSSSAVWNAGKPFLASLGVQNPGSMIGRWLKGHSPLEILSAIEAAQKSGTQDPIPYITEALKGKHHERKPASKSKERMHAFIAGARRSPGVDSRQGADPSKPLLAGR